MDNKKLCAISNALGGVLIVLWGVLHIFIIPEIQTALIDADVDQSIISLVSLSYLGIVVMISSSGLLVILAALLGIQKGEKWAYFFVLTQGIIFWVVLPDADQIAFRTRAEEERQARASREGRTVRPRVIRASPNHIDLWDPVSRSLPGTGGFSMTWVPESGIVESVRFWPIPFRGPFRVNPHALPRGMQLT